MRGRGCAHCNGSGYQGRVGVYEMLEMTPALVHAANRGDTNAFSEGARRQLAGRTLSIAAAKLAAAGRTSVAEALRISSVDED